ncbi:hypothetical protein F183_A47430 [Bryobacterales bacterium F-183]|nr:hypothetical protein F183_A47430 [Bryobacterales bacterium F-183]
MLAKDVAASLRLSQSEVSKAIRRCVESGLLHWTDLEWRVNRAGLVEFLIHGIRYVFPLVRGTLVRGYPTGAWVEPLKGMIAAGDPPEVWTHPNGTVRGLAVPPLYKTAPEAAIRDEALYRMFALCDALRGGRARERKLAAELVKAQILHA